MQPQSDQDYKQLLTDVIKKQIVILGPDITLSKARNVKGLTVANDGTVTNVEGQSQEVIQALIDQFVQLSGLIVKKTMEPLLSLSQTVSSAVPAPQPEIPISQPSSPILTPSSAAQPAIINPTEPVAPTPASSVQQPPIPPAQSVSMPQATAQATQTSQPAGQPTPNSPQTDTNLTPANNPLAA